MRCRRIALTKVVLGCLIFLSFYCFLFFLYITLLNYEKSLATGSTTHAEDSNTMKML